MRCIRYMLLAFISVGLLSALMFPGPSRAQAGARVAFGISPTAFQAGQSAEAVLSVSSLSVTALTISPGDTFTFFVDQSIGSVTGLASSISASSSSLSPADFSASFGGALNQVVITYNGQSKSLNYGDSFSLEVSLTASAHLGSGKVSFSCRFVSPVNGDLPYTTVSIVDFTNGVSGLAMVAHDSTLIGDGTGKSLLGIAPGGVGTTQLADGSVTGTKFRFPLNITGSSLFGQSLILIFNEGTGPFSDGLGAIVHNGAGLVGDTGIGDSGVLGQAAGTGDGVDGFSSGGAGVSGDGSIGVFGFSQTGDGVLGQSTNGLAGHFMGDVQVTGNVFKAGGSFKIDHPLDPANKYLYHSFVESPDMKNIYDGVTVLDASGEAAVELPEWFGALNKDFRYQLTAIGAPGPNLYIAEKVHANRFKIAGGGPGMEVSWQVTGIRQDAWANAHRIPIEEAKSEAERGHYLHPELYGHPPHESSDWQRNAAILERHDQKTNRRVRQ